ncbi:MAG TPA: adenylate/guanylate cyclase domain-containing protein [Bauldia sp.]|nr:adenylate/guanylate cyclase domain-containing protein [Bauldia sp.]
MTVRTGWTYVLLVVAALVGATALRVLDPFFLQALRLIAFDSYQRLEPEAYDPAMPVRVVDIDEESLARVGQWPWPRTTIAQLVDRLAAQGAAAIAFDILFAEPDQTSPEQFLARLPPEEAASLGPLLAGRVSHDSVLADAIGRAPTVLAAALTARPSGVPLPAKAGFAVAGDDPLPFMPRFAGSSSNLPILDEKASGIGAINWIPDRDQVVRRISIVYGLGDRFVPALFAEALRVAQGASTYILKSSNASGESAFGRETGLNNIKWGAIETPTDADGAIWLQFRHSNPAAFIPAWKVLSGENDPGEVAGVILLVGTSAPGLNDLRATPLDAALPGVEIHAQAIEHILSGRTLSRPDYAPAVEVLLVLLVGAALGVVLPRVSAGSAALLGSSIILAIFVGGWLAYDRLHILIDPSYPALAIAFLVAVATLYVYRRVEQQRSQVRLAFSHYVAPAVVDELIAHPERLELGGEVRELTILFCDVRNFTSISETLTAHELTHFINSLLTPLTDIILKRRGTIDKYMGDAIMAFWNAPLDDPAHAGNACAAAVEIAERMRDLNDAWRREAEEKGRRYVPVAVGIGINSGNCCVGNLGSSQRFDYSAIGDDVNVASRLEGLSKQYGVTIVVGETTAAQVKDSLLELDLIKVKGRTAPSRLYTMTAALGATEMALAKLMPLHAAMLAAYRDRSWDRAEALIAECRAIGVAALGKLYDVYQSRIEFWRESPPPADWDGSFTATEK